MTVGLGKTTASLNMTFCEVIIGDLQLKITGTKASFIYNALFSLFSGTIKRAIEKGLTDMIRNTLTQSLTEALRIM